tara:strand:- start:149 stop:283 length:135 start_codon:yes stop_codon:yes gene_type:complete
MLTYEEKLAKYLKGEYLMPVPGTCPVGWSDRNWIDFIDNHGKWC